MTLEEALKNIDPEMSPERIQALVTAIQEKIDSAKDEGRKAGLAKTQELVEEKDAECSAKLEEYATTVNEVHAAKMQSLVEDMDALHAEKLTTIVEAIDGVCTDKMMTLKESIEEDHAAKLTKVLEAVDNDRSAKLELVAEVFEEKAAAKVEEFMNSYIEEAMPTAQATDTAKLARLEDAMNQLREILAVNDDFVQTEVKEALFDANDQLEEKQVSINDLMVENMGLRKKIKKDEATSLLESIVADMKPAMAAFVEHYFDGVEDAKTIFEKKDEAIKAFEADEADETEFAIEESRGSQVVIPDDVEETVIEESVETPDFMDLYADKIKRSTSLMHRVETHN